MKLWKSRRTGLILVQNGEHFNWLETGAVCYPNGSGDAWVECVVVERGQTSDLRRQVEELAAASKRDGRGGCWIHDFWFDTVLR